MNSVKERGAARRALLAAAAVAAVVSLASLAAVLGVYASGASPSPVLVAVGLYGLPVAFMLGAALLLVHLAERRRA